MSITPGLFNNIIFKASLDITGAHNQNIKEEKGKQRSRRKKERLAAARAPPMVATPRLRKRFLKNDTFEREMLHLRNDCYVSYVGSDVVVFYWALFGDTGPPRNSGGGLVRVKWIT